MLKRDVQNNFTPIPKAERAHTHSTKTHILILTHTHTHPTIHKYTRLNRKRYTWHLQDKSLMHASSKDAARFVHRWYAISMTFSVCCIFAILL